MTIKAGSAANIFDVNGREYRVEYARMVLARSVFKTKSTLIIPDDTKKKYAPTKGVVVAVGETADEYWKQSLGKEIIFARFAGDWVKLDESDSEEDMVFICQDEDALVTRVE